MEGHSNFDMNGTKIISSFNIFCILIAFFCQLGEINSRVGATIGEYEANSAEDDAFELVAEEDGHKFTSLWDNKSVLADSKGKVL